MYSFGYIIMDKLWMETNPQPLMNRLIWDYRQRQLKYATEKKKMEQQLYLSHAVHSVSFIDLFLFLCYLFHYQFQFSVVTRQKNTKATVVHPKAVFINHPTLKCRNAKQNGTLAQRLPTEA
jgi:hypothetical protein